MKILDTDVLTLLFHGHERIIERRRRETDEISITIISRIQALQGRFATILTASNGAALIRAQQWLDETIRNLDAIPRIVPIDGRSAAEFDRLRQIKKLKKIGRADLLIAAITLANHATLVSRNLKDFHEVPGLQVENWAD